MNGALVPRKGRRPRGPSLRSASSASSRAAAASNEACSSIAFGNGEERGRIARPLPAVPLAEVRVFVVPPADDEGLDPLLVLAARPQEAGTLGSAQPLVAVAGVHVRPEPREVERELARTWAPSTIERTPARRAASQICAIGSSSAVGDVMCETTTARVRIPMFQTSSSGSTRTTFRADELERS